MTDLNPPVSAVEEARKRLLARAPYYEDFDFESKVRSFEIRIRAEERQQVVREATAAITAKLGITSRALPILRALVQEDGEGQ